MCRHAGYQKKDQRRAHGCGRLRLALWKSRPPECSLRFRSRLLSVDACTGLTTGEHGTQHVDTDELLEQSDAYDIALSRA